jgi:excisionase family DNA binding protein
MAYIGYILCRLCGPLVEVETAAPAKPTWLAQLAAATMADMTACGSQPATNRPETPKGEAMSDTAVVSPYFTAAEAAEYLRTTKQGIYALVKRGRLRKMPGRPGRLLFTQEALDRYLSGRFRR